MTDITIKEIPVQVLNVPDGSVLVLRVHPDATREERYYLSDVMNEALRNRDVRVVVLNDDIDLAVVSK